MPSCFPFNAPPTTQIYTLSLHDALPIALRTQLSIDLAIHARHHFGSGRQRNRGGIDIGKSAEPQGDRKSTRLNSSHVKISYAVFCLKKKKMMKLCSLRAVLTQARDPQTA